MNMMQGAEPQAEEQPVDEVRTQLQAAVDASTAALAAYDGEEKEEPVAEEPAIGAQKPSAFKAAIGLGGK